MNPYWPEHNIGYIDELIAALKMLAMSLLSVLLAQIGRIRLAVHELSLGRKKMLLRLKPAPGAGAPPFSIYLMRSNISLAAISTRLLYKEKGMPSGPQQESLEKHISLATLASSIVLGAVAIFLP